MTEFLPLFALLPDIGGGEMLLVMFVVLLLFGPDKLPHLAKGIGKTMREFKRAASQVEREIKQAIDEVPDTPIDNPFKPKPAPLSQPTLTQPTAAATTIAPTPPPTENSPGPTLNPEPPKPETPAAPPPGSTPPTPPPPAA
ncbi:MAG: twin-arginine translocase TatA/TatE family subunit [Opitutus sp.]|nr:twin-arginine translocase TatA/TatE family subunit [Opitutus sp.]